MMTITLRSRVRRALPEVFKAFNADLFRYLLPPGARLIEFGGSRKGDIVHLKLPLAGEWLSEITEDATGEEECYFVDEGRRLPFPLINWRHKHILRRDGDHTIIEDKMTFSAGNGLADVLAYPFLYLAFLPRVWQYKQYFRAA